MKRFLAVTVAIWTVFTTNANPITVQELTTSPYEIVQIKVPGLYTGGAYAGVVKLLVDGTPMDGFCIDPYHFSSSSPLLYDEVPLASAPKPPGPMGAAKALQIENLWTLNYSPTMSAPNAAGLQVAIWLTLKDLDPTRVVSIIGNDYGAAGMISAASAYTGPHVTLNGLTGSGQDYVVQSVPEVGTSLLLMGMALSVVMFVQSKWRASKLLGA